MASLVSTLTREQLAGPEHGRTDLLIAGGGSRVEDRAALSVPCLRSLEETPPALPRASHRRRRRRGCQASVVPEGRDSSSRSEGSGRWSCRTGSGYHRTASGDRVSGGS